MAAAPSHVCLRFLCSMQATELEQLQRYRPTCWPCLPSVASWRSANNRYFQIDLPSLYRIAIPYFRISSTVLSTTCLHRPVLFHHHKFSGFCFALNCSRTNGLTTIRLLPLREELFNRSDPSLRVWILCTDATVAISAARRWGRTGTGVQHRCRCPGPGAALGCCRRHCRRHCRFTCSGRK